MNYKVVETHRFNTVGDLLKLLQNLDPSQRMYPIDANDEYISRLDILEGTTSDGSKVTDIRLRSIQGHRT